MDPLVTRVIHRLCGRNVWDVVERKPCCRSTGRATCHTAEATLDVLRPVFKDRIISSRADVV